MKSKRNRLLHSDSDSDPMGTVANLFDVAMVFAVALMVALVSRFLCGRQLISGERVLCLKCLSGLPRTQFHLRKDNIVECNFWGKIPVEHATSFLYYAKGGNVRQLLYELKYHGNQEVGEVMGRMMASELMCSHFFDGIDLIVPVPLHQRKKRLRGYNQSECLADILF